MTIALSAVVCVTLLLLIPNYAHERRIALRHASAVRRSRVRPRRDFGGYQRY